mmetsp:Transcript_31287/g.97336  ORF Transcript_31287/g.97336 Transcript_31287/m.97336 type:complete len:243 (-) Transcript_31287:95-823(-)
MKPRRSFSSAVSRILSILRLPSSRRCSSAFIVGGTRPSSTSWEICCWNSAKSLCISRKDRPSMRYRTLPPCCLLAPERSCRSSSRNSNAPSGALSSSWARRGLTAKPPVRSWCGPLARYRGMGAWEASQRAGSASPVRSNSRNREERVKLWCSPWSRASQRWSSSPQGTGSTADAELLSFCVGRMALRSWPTVSLSGSSMQMAEPSLSSELSRMYLNNTFVSSRRSSVDSHTTSFRREKCAV